MGAVKRLLLVCLLLSLSGCMSLLLQAPETDVPVSLSERLYGYRTGQKVGRIEREIWTYHLLGLAQFPLGTREGLSTDRVLSDTLEQQVRPGQGVIRLKVRHTRTPLTWLASIFSLGLLSPTAVIIEGDIVEIWPLTP